MSGVGTVVVVGASLAGVRTIKALRRHGHTGRTVLVGSESELPYDRPPLSKAFLTSPEPIPVKRLEPETFYDDVEVHLGTAATALHRDTREVELADGRRLRGDHVVIATGAAARGLPGVPDGERILRLRTAQDARRLRQLALTSEHVLVVGAGFVGSEVASSLNALGVRVTVVEPAPVPVLRAVGPLVGHTIADLHRSHGVDVRLGTGVEQLAEGPKGVSVTLTGGEVVHADAAVVGVGAIPCTDWLLGSGVELGNGVRADARSAVLGGGGHVWAAGDVVSWPSALFGEERRLEHWTNAAEQAGVLAENLLGISSARPYDPVPYVWSHQYEHTFQIVGSVSGTDDVALLRGSLEERRFALTYSRDGVLRGLVACDMPREVITARPLIAAGTPLAQVA